MSSSLPKCGEHVGNIFCGDPTVIERVIAPEGDGWRVVVTRGSSARETVVRPVAGSRHWPECTPQHRANLLGSSPRPTA